MSTSRLRSYRFADQAHWQTGISHRVTAPRDGGLASTTRLGTTPQPVTTCECVTLLATAPDGSLFWRVGEGHTARLRVLRDGSVPSHPFEMHAALARAARWIAGRDWLWASGGQCVTRYDLEHLQHDRTLPFEQPVLDIAGAGADGLYVLLADGSLVELDCRARELGRRALPAGGVSQLSSTTHGARLILLSEDGWKLWVLSVHDLSVERELRLQAPQRSTTSDRKQRVLTLGSHLSLATLYDGTGDRLDEISLESMPRCVTVAGDVVWIGTDDGLWRLDASSQPRESDSTFLTPRLTSPEVGTERGWLRAELDVALPAGALLEVQAATALEPARLAAVAALSADRTLGNEEKQQRIWEQLNALDSFQISGPAGAESPISVPLFEATEPQLWLRVRMVVPPGVTLPRLRELRIVYPNVSIAEQLPAIFRGERYDPTGFLRRFVGVLEATTQSVDQRIREIGEVLDGAQSAPAWLDYLARWLDLPWDDGLPVAAKRRILAQGAALLAQRGTRAGLASLLRCLLGPDAFVSVHDLMVESAPARLGGSGRVGIGLPVLLAGPSRRVALLDSGASLGRARIACETSACSPLSAIVPTVRIVLGASLAEQRALAPLLHGILTQYVPALVRFTVLWRSSANVGVLTEGPQAALLGEGPGKLDQDGVLGRTVLRGRHVPRVDDEQL